MKGKDRLWTQLEHEEDFHQLGRKISLTSEPWGTLSVFSIAKFEDYWEQGSEVPIAPYPPQSESAFGYVD